MTNYTNQKKGHTRIQMSAPHSQPVADVAQPSFSERHFGRGNANKLAGKRIPIGNGALRPSAYRLEAKRTLPQQQGGQGAKKDIWIDNQCVGETVPDMFFHNKIAGGSAIKISAESEFSPNDLHLNVDAGKIISSVTISRSAFSSAAQVLKKSASDKGSSILSNSRWPTPAIAVPPNWQAGSDWTSVGFLYSLCAGAARCASRP